MTNLWFNDPSILLQDMTEFFPTNNLTRIEKVNSIARLAIYYAIIITLFKQDNKWYTVSLVLLIISYFLGYFENFEDVKNDTSNCIVPIKEILL